MITIALIFNSELIIRIFLGSEWMNVNSLFIILSLSGVCMINGSLGDIYLRSLAFTKQQFFLRILQAVASICLIFSVAKIGIQAVAVEDGVAYCIVVIVKMKFISEKINFGLKAALSIILQSYKVSILYVAGYIMCKLFIPNTVSGNIIKLFFFF